MNQQEFEDTARRYREEMFRLYANQSMTPPPKPMPPMNQPQPPMPPTNQPQPPMPPMNQPQPPMDLPTEQPPAPPEAHYGSVRVAVSTARGARPVPGAIVTITREMNGREHLFALQITDESGETGEILLPAPAPSENQQHPDYYGYDIHVYAPGYYRESGMQVPVFPNILSLQRFDLIPLPAGVTDSHVSGDLMFYNHMKDFETGGEAHAQR